MECDWDFGNERHWKGISPEAIAMLEPYVPSTPSNHASLSFCTRPHVRPCTVTCCLSFMCDFRSHSAATQARFLFFVVVVEQCTCCSLVCTHIECTRGRGTELNAPSHAHTLTRRPHSLCQLNIVIDPSIHSCLDLMV